MKILLFDNYDSFTYNIAHALRDLGVEPDVVRNDKISLDDVEKYDKIIISPGPGIPEEAGVLMSLLKRYAKKKPILGVCLGHQAIGENFGATLHNLPEVYHGVATSIKVVKKDYLFEGLPEEFKVGRYHSWVVDKKNFPINELEVTAIDDNGMIMALRHKIFDIRGVQFHPESVLTPEGKRIIQNWLQHERVII